MGTDHKENGTRGKHCTATCVNETRTPKPRTDTTRALTKNLQTNNMHRQQQKQAHKPTRTQLYREKRQETKQKVLADQLTWVSNAEKTCCKRATCNVGGRKSCQFFHVNTTTTISVYGKNGWWRAFRVCLCVCVCVWERERECVCVGGGGVKQQEDSSARKTTTEKRYVGRAPRNNQSTSNNTAQCYQVFFLPQSIIIKSTTKTTKKAQRADLIKKNLQYAYYSLYSQ